MEEPQPSSLDSPHHLHIATYLDKLDKDGALHEYYPNKVELLAIWSDILRFLRELVVTEERNSQDAMDSLEKRLESVELNQRVDLLTSLISKEEYPPDRLFIELIEKILPISEEHKAQKRELIKQLCRNILRLGKNRQIAKRLLETKARVEELLRLEDGKKPRILKRRAVPLEPPRPLDLLELSKS